MERKGVLRLASEVAIGEDFGGIEGMPGGVEAGVDLVGDDSLREGLVGQGGDRRRGGRFGTCWGRGRCAAGRNRQGGTKQGKNSFGESHDSGSLPVGKVNCEAYTSRVTIGRFGCWQTTGKNRMRERVRSALPFLSIIFGSFTFSASFFVPESVPQQPWLHFDVGPQCANESFCSYFCLPSSPLPRTRRRMPG